MAYELKHGPDQKALKERLETATACLERFKALKAKQALNIKIYDRTGAEVAIAELEKDTVVRESLGAHICERFISAKRLECEEYRLEVTPWELKKYLPNY